MALQGHLRKGGLSAAVIVALVISGSSAGQAQEPAKTISVSARAAVGKVPDRALMRFNVVAQEKEPPAALAANAEAVQKLLSQIRAKGVESKDIQTTSLSIRAKYEMSRDGNREVRGPLVGYIAAKSVTVTIRDLSAIPDFVREFPIAGPVRIADIGFFSSQAKEAIGEALVKAVEEAERNARAVTAAASRQLGDVSSISLHVMPPNQWRQMPSQDAAEDALGARLLLEPGEQRFEQSVDMRWSLR
jgi:hypothetical protein